MNDSAVDARTELQSFLQATGERYAHYCDLLMRWSRRMNLIGPSEAAQLGESQLIDALGFARCIAPDARCIVDLGSGAGLPGAVLAMARPDWQLHLIEARRRRAAFLRQVAIELHLDNLSVHSGRAEAFTPRQSVDTIVSRGFGPLARQIDCTRTWWAAETELITLRGSEERDPPPDGFALRCIAHTDGRAFFCVRRASGA
ncbi:MAG: 16S rRNA (guanine(527)-N(7))-methyltransferase RsmG [Gammaproteobacteria bacterium AqS3]|nr:16S rRNA (guanine(527)-N(7))-methyltransferase RsmG [Gammaproteobacteria bacterium AqS3]